MRIISYGGGVQSTALIVLAIQGRIQADCALFSNVGDDSEFPKTLIYTRTIMQPFCDAHGFPVSELGRVNRSGGGETLRGKLMKPESRSIPIPVRGPRTGAPGTRSCTVDFKIRVIDRWCREHGATEENPFTKLVGFSTDELERASGRRTDWTIPEYPLLTAEINMSRSQCEDLIARAGLPVPPKSSCYFCPFHRPATWSEMRRDEPELFWDAVHIEATLNARRATLRCAASIQRATRKVKVHDHEDVMAMPSEEIEVQLDPGTIAACPRCEEPLIVDGGGLWPEHMKGPMFFTRFGKPLDEAIPEAQAALFDYREGSESCDEGGCHT